MKEVITSSPFFGITISIIGYALGNALYKRTKKELCNPLLVAIAFVILVVLLFDIPVANYQNGGKLISMFLSPATAVLAITIYRERNTIRKNALAIIMGTLGGSIASIIYIWVLSRILSLDETMALSIIPKGITTPMALSVSKALGGMEGLTMLSVLVTGIFGNISAEMMIKLFRVKSAIPRGVAIGTSSHVVGTSKAMEIGEEEGSISGVSLILTGIITTILSLIIFS